MNFQYLKAKTVKIKSDEYILITFLKYSISINILILGKYPARNKLK